VSAGLHVGVIGVGNMGGAMARRLLDQGCALSACDIDASRVLALQAAGAVAAAQPESLAPCALVIVAVVDALQTHQVLFGRGGVAAAMAPGGCVMLCPTIAPAHVEACAAGLAERGIACIDAPMSGGPLRARDGTMSLMVACDDAVFERWHGVLRLLASRLFRVGTRIGDGARTKLVNNLLAAINLAGAAEALALASRLDLDPALTLSVIEQSSGQSWIGSDRLRRALADEAAPLAHMALLAKDSALALQAARPTALPLPLGNAAAQTFASALQSGLAAADDSALWRWMLGESPQQVPPK